jgi:O-antigen/teichoic acid export membrane protein
VFTYNKLIKYTIQFTSYSGSTLFAKVLGFLFLPIMARHLSSTEFGVVSLINSIISIASTIAVFGLPPLVLMNFVNLSSKEEKEDLVKTLFNLFYRFFLLFIIIFVPGFLMSEKMWNKSGIAINTYLISGFIVLTVYFSFVQNIGNNVLRMENRISLLSTARIISSGFSFGVGLLLLLVFKAGFYSLLAMQVVGMVIFLPVLTSTLSKNTLSFSHLQKKQFGRLKESTPFMVENLINMVLFTSDRWIIVKFLTFSDVGLYEMGYKFAILYDLIFVQTFNTLYMPWLFNKLKTDYKRYSRFNIILALLNMGLILLLLLVPNGVWNILSPILGVNFSHSIPLIRLIMSGYIALHSASLINLIFIYLHKSYWLPIFATVSLAISFTGNLFMVPKFGIVGAATMMPITFSCATILQLLIVRKIKPNIAKPSLIKIESLNANY